MVPRSNPVPFLCVRIPPSARLSVTERNLQKGRHFIFVLPIYLNNSSEKTLSCGLDNTSVI